ncbi:kelch repeat-containing protein [Algoriphagus sp. D3-2-R+10]|uniref:Kelch repeat-containing protein n=1 Tax=Algoriphagus aurantiacus TaxID=3103948 RepID=UPI002B3D8487|nr:kelch repeat-containing protein [Algoriphagus sp. D3-2-R+10]MEB2774415.1 kelch repeat-containing protein [Algoriphagus sp. D3-2-R+10]
MKKVNQLLSTLAALIMLVPLFSCQDSDDTNTEGNWVRKSYFEGSNRSNSSSFSVDNRHFVVGGYTGDEYTQDLWEYDAVQNSWIRRADFPGTARSNAVAFAIDSKGYYGTGYDGRNRLGDFWSYNPDSDTWTEVSSFPGTPRYGSIGFAIAGKGFIGTGFDGSEQKDFWQYQPETDTWNSFISMGGAKRQGAFVFVINEVAYIGGGVNNGSYAYDFWALDGTSETWSQKEDLDEDDDYTISRSEAVGFSIGSLGYLATGSQGSLISETWEYDPSLDDWEDKTAFEGTARTGASVFSDGDRAFVLLGRSSSLRFDDIWEFLPFEDSDDED